MKRTKTFVCLMLAFFAINASAAESKFYKELKKFYDQHLPSEAFVPTPYGADDRFRPKSVWIYVDDLFKGKAAGTKKGWVIASNGESIYRDTFAKSNSAPITLPIRDADRKSKWGFSAAVSGTVSGDELDAGIDLAMENGLDVSVDVGAAEVEYVYYFDMLIAQEASSIQRAKLVELVKKANDNKSPTMRVTLAALRVKGTKIEINATKDFKGSISATLGKFLSKLGLTYDSEKKVFDSLNFDDWRYVAYEAKISDADLNISSSGVPDDPGNDTATVSENFDFLRP